MTQVRLVETGLDDAGRSTVVADRLVDARELPTGRVLNPLWGNDADLDAPPGGAEPGLFPSAGGARFWLFTVRANEAQTGHALHRTSTIDLGFIVAGGGAPGRCVCAERHPTRLPQPRRRRCGGRLGRPWPLTAGQVVKVSGPSRSKSA